MDSFLGTIGQFVYNVGKLPSENEDFKAADWLSSVNPIEPPNSCSPIMSQEQIRLSRVKVSDTELWTRGASDNSLHIRCFEPRWDYFYRDVLMWWIFNSRWSVSAVCWKKWQCLLKGVANASGDLGLFVTWVILAIGVWKKIEKLMKYLNMHGSYYHCYCYDYMRKLGSASPFTSLFVSCLLMMSTVLSSFPTIAHFTSYL